MERLFLTGSGARGLRRLARREAGLTLETLKSSEIQALSRRWSSEHSQDLVALRTLLGMRDKPLRIRVPSANARVRARNIKSVVCSVGLPNGSFERVTGDNGPCAYALPKLFEVATETPPLSFLMAAQQLMRLVSRGSITRQESTLRLAKLGLEDCGTYALDPQNPAGGITAFGVAPASSADAIRAYLGQVHGVDGMALAKKAAPLLFDGAASEMESFLVSALGFPPHLGGLGFKTPKVNEVIDLSNKQQLMLNHVKRLTPDLLWPDLMIASEYLGLAAHEGREAHNEDTDRMQDFQALGYDVVPIDFRHVRNPQAFNRLAVRIASVMESRGAKGMHAWVDELLADEDFLEKQRVLFKVMLPTVHNR